jgi:nucleotide-binding universal stress UspA family protein
VPLLPYIPILAILLNLTLAVFLFFYRPLGIIVCLGYILLGIVLFYIYAKKKEFTAKAEPVIHAEAPILPASPSSYRILVPVANKANVEKHMRFASKIADANNGDLTVLNVIQVPAQLPSSEGRKYLSQARSLLGIAIQMAESQDIPVHSLVKLTHNIPKAIVETCEERDINLMILGWEGKIPAHNRVFGTKLDDILLNTICDIALVCRAPSKEKEINRILIPVSNIRYAILSLKIAENLLFRKKTSITLLHATISKDTDSIKRRLQEELEKKADVITPSRYKVIVKTSSNIPDAIMAETQFHDLIIMGAPEEGLVRRALSGDLSTRIVQELDIPLILTKRYTGHIKSWFQKFFGSRKTMLD